MHQVVADPLEQGAAGLLDTYQIAVMPGESFGKAATGHIRLALTVEDAQLMRATKILAEFVQTLSKDAR